VPHLSAEQRWALVLLASSRHGINEQMLARSLGFGSGVLASFVRRRFAAREREVVVMAGSKAIEVVRLRITAAGRFGGDGRRRKSPSEPAGVE
jgi:hypothetical protein